MVDKFRVVVEVSIVAFIDPPHICSPGKRKVGQQIKLSYLQHIKLSESGTHLHLYRATPQDKIVDLHWDQRPGYHCDNKVIHQESVVILQTQGGHLLKGKAPC